VIVIQPKHFGGSEDDPNDESVIVFGTEEYDKTEKQMGNYFDYPLVLITRDRSDRIDVRFFYHVDVLGKNLVRAIADQLDHVV
jgi:hypothetical protein